MIPHTLATFVAAQKQRGTGEARDGNRGPGPLLCLMALFCDPGATAGLFRMVRWAHGLFCPHCRDNPVIKHGRYRRCLQRHPCKGCGRTFNDRTGTILHYRHIWLGNWMLALWAFLCGPPNGVSINHIAESIGCTCRFTYYLVRRMMDKVRGLPEGRLSGTGETDEGYIRAGSKGVALVDNGEDRTIPSRRGLPRGPGRGTFEKNTLMATIYHQRATGDEPGLTLFEVPVNDGRTLAGRVAGKFERGSTVITDEHPACRNLGEMGYDHRTVNHGEGGSRLGRSQRDTHEQLRVPGGPAQVVAEEAPGGRQVVPGVVRQVVPVRPQPPPLRRQRKVPGGAGRDPGPGSWAAGLIPGCFIVDYIRPVLIRIFTDGIIFR